MMHELYDIISIYVTIGLLTLGGLSFLFVTVPESPLLDSYRKARIILSFAYLFFAAVNMVEYAFRNDGSVNDLLLRMVTLAVAFSQAFLFTFAMISLINVRWIEKRRFIRELMPVMAYIAAVFFFYFVFPAAFYVLFVLYLVQLIRYTRQFVLNYRQFRQKMDNYFSGLEKQKMQWVTVSFFLALGIGIIALVTALFPTVYTGIASSVIYLLFYGWFAIRFISYPHVFGRIEEIFADSDESPPVSGIENDKKYTADASKLERRIDDWINRKMFTNPNVSLGDLSREFAINRYYLSKYINENRHCNFNAWVNGLRIEEAKRLLQNNPGMTVSDVAEQTGFSSCAYFGKLFLKNAGQTPQQWRKTLNST
jgi:AraC-like DNA-binding protein